MIGESQYISLCSFSAPSVASAVRKKSGFTWAVFKEHRQQFYCPRCKISARELGNTSKGIEIALAKLAEEDRTW